MPPIPPVPGGNNSLSFDGINDYINIGKPTPLNNGEYGSVSLWFKNTTYTENSNGGATLFSNDTRPTNPEFQVFLYDEGNVYISGGPGSVNGPQFTSDGTYNDGIWHHLVGIKSAPNCVSLYVDNIYLGSNCNGSGDMDAGNDWFIGASRTGGIGGT